MSISVPDQLYFPHATSPESRTRVPQNNGMNVMNINPCWINDLISLNKQYDPIKQTNLSGFNRVRIGKKQKEFDFNRDSFNHN